MNDPVSARKKIYRLALDAMLVAIYVVLSLVPSEISWASLPVLVCAFLLRPIDAIAITLCGSFIEQLWYGFNVTSLIWMLPWAVFAVFAGFGAAWVRKNPKVWKTALVIVCAEILLNVGNTSALLYFGYASIDPSKFAAGLSMPVVAILTYLVRMPHAVIRAVLSSVVIPILLPPLRKVLSKLR